MGCFLKRLSPALLMLLSALLALTACLGEGVPPASVPKPSATLPAEYGAAEVQTSTLIPTEDSATVSRPTATFLPSLTPSPTATAAKPTATLVPLLTPSPTANADKPTRADVPRVDVGEAKIRAEAGEAILVDVRTRATYEQQHIAGALSMPSAEVPERYAELPAGKLIIFYCA